ncbi:MAG TPA: 6-phosphogluconolactonase [Bacteroidales bacterium]|nr:6-phosphogluconolactonase [Bacteroidales bacterium]
MRQYDKLLVQWDATKKESGISAGKAIIDKINELLQSKNELRMIFAAAPSQSEVLAYLVSHKDEVAWEKITAFHMDEYIGLDKNDTNRFSSFLRANIFDHIPFGKVHFIDSDNPLEVTRYSGLLSEKPIDIVCLGIGENGHLAFNDPPVANFNDPEVVKVVELDPVCRQQQVNDGCFDQLSDVPKQAVTLTIPTLFQAGYLYCVVPGESKKEAVHKTLHDEISEACPSTIVRSHENCILYVDQDACPGL